MILGIVVFIVCLCGIFGFYDGNLAITYIGFALGIIEHIIGVVTGQSKGFSTLGIAFWFAVGGSLAGNNFLEMLAICVCFENVICFGLGLIVLLFAGTAMHKYEQNEKKIIENVEYETEFFEELKRKNAEYDKEIKSQPVYCTECGTKLEDNASFCHNCGAQIKE